MSRYWNSLTIDREGYLRDNFGYIDDKKLMENTDVKKELLLFGFNGWIVSDDNGLRDDEAS